MSHRKLQQEMDRVFKKINEGLELFNTLYDRHEGCTNPSQKEKLESDLKKEIKKLQRFREQVKNWQATNDVKDKDKLNENRRLVEQAMEQYKIVEKGSKTKAYSDESLMNAALDPEEQEKYEAIDFVQSSLDELQRQTESLEAELDKMLSNKKSKRGNSYANEERKAEIDASLFTHKWHQERLETILRVLENGALQPDGVLGIQEDVKYYLESNQEVDFMDDDTIYDDLNLDAIENTVNDLYTVPEEASAASTPVKAKIKLDTKEAEDQPSPVPKSVTVKKPLSRSGPVVVGIPTPSVTPALPSNLKPAVVPAKPAGGLKWSVAASAATATSAGASSPAASASPSATVSPLTTSNGSGQDHSPVLTAAAASAHASQISAAAAVTAALKSDVESKHQLTALPTSVPSVSTTMSINAANAASVLEALKNRKQHEVPAQEQPPVNPLAVPSTNGTKKSQPSTGDSSLETDEQLACLPSGIQSIILSFVAARQNADESATPITDIASAVFVPRYHSPLPTESIPPPLEAQRVALIWNSIRSSGNLQLAAQNVDTATLFYAYYFSQTPYERNVSEAVLNSRQWRMHLSKRMWFQRSSQPKLLGEGFEISDFKVFDATSWSLKERIDYKFEYDQLSAVSSSFPTV
ncbi:unnamed protein product [Kuraishia capsulata CBS 1993]|uniref:General negative regulator of transcription subunit n=1 Tax=Kuraishia capsulata CBS 1993 TaxID=1382522 RepID=W6MSD1_9ASCO|nr:uncharacterized protein KUCA_T00005286001 [Kuraishia capsulata CBS 1993]CDK29298.1 unnamed protein product [Kuraishia capsulata CBS 1993]